MKFTITLLILSLPFLCREGASNTASCFEASLFFVIFRTSLLMFLSQEIRASWYSLENSGERNKPWNSTGPAPDRSSVRTGCPVSNPCFPVTHDDSRCCGSSDSSKEYLLWSPVCISKSSVNRLLFLRDPALPYLQPLQLQMRRMTQASANHGCVPCTWVRTCPRRSYTEWILEILLVMPVCV